MIDRLWHKLATFLILVSALWCTSNGVSLADDETQHATAYRRVFVPADAPETWPVGSQRFLPVPQKEFLQLVEKIKRSEAGHQQAPVSMSKASHWVELNDGLLTGNTEFAVQLPNNETQLLWLSPLNIAVQTAAWRSTPNEAATFGMWERATGKIEPGVEVKQSDTLQLGWQLNAQREDETRLSFELKLPVVEPQTLELRLPANHSVTLTPGQLLETKPGLLGETVWIFQLAASESHEIQITRPAASRETEPLPLASRVTSYQLTPPGLKVDTQFRIDARGRQLPEIRADISLGLRVVRVSIDGQQASWQVVNRVGEDLLIIDRPASKYPQLVEIHGLAKFATNVAWSLPKVRLSEIGWTEGTTSLVVSPKLRLLSLHPKLSALQHIVGVADNSVSGEVFRFQEWSDESTIEVMVGHREPQLSVRSATTLDLGRNEAKAGVAAVFSNVGREQFQLQADIADGWAIESVTTTPQSALVQWQIDRDGDNSQLQLQLNRPIAVDDDLQIEVKAGRTAGSAVLPAQAGQLEIVRFLDADITQQLLLLRTRETQPLKLSEVVEKTRLEVGNLSAEEAELLPEVDTGTLLDVTSLARSEVVAILPETAQYDGEVQVEVQIAAESTSYHYTIDCQPTSGAISTVLLECDAPLPESLQWRLSESKEVVLAMQVGSRRQNETAPASASLYSYVLVLPSAKVDAFRLQTDYTLPAEKIEQCNPIRLSQANHWSGRVLVRGDLSAIQVLDHDWMPAIYAALDSEERLPILGCYRLGPTENRPTRGKAITFRRKSTLPQAPAVVAWLAEYRTLQAANGAAIHSASYSLENLMEERVEIALPEIAHLQEAWLGDKLLAPEEINKQGNTYDFRLPTGQRWILLTLKYSTSSSGALGDSAVLQPTVPQCSFPINLNRWTLLAPEQYQIDGSERYYASNGYPWWKRLFGPLARLENEKVFNPAQPQAWKHLFSDPLVAQQTRQAAKELSQQLADRLAVGTSETWGELMSELTSAAPTKNLVVLDHSALLASGIDAATPSRGLGVELTPQAQALPLSAYGIALLASPNSILLTTEQRVSLWRDQLKPTETPGVFTIDVDTLTSTLENRLAAGSANITSVNDWKQIPRLEESVWDHSSLSELDDVGRHVEAVEFLQTAPSLTVRRTFVQRALWYAVLLLTLVLGVWQIALHPNRLILAWAIAGAVCLVVPIRWLTIPQAIFLGLFYAAILRILFKSSTSIESKTALELKPLRSASAVVVLLLTIANSSLAQPLFTGKPTAAAAAAELPLVLVPIDAKGSRQGEDVYLSTNFLRSLQQANSVNLFNRRKWVLQEAVYSGNLPDNLDESFTDRLNLDTPWTLQWKLESFAANTRVVLPLQKADALWQTDLHRLDGVPVRLQWLDQGKGCSVVLPEPGVHWLKIVASPRVQINEGEASLQLHIPPLPGARLDLATASSLAKLEIPSAMKTAGNSTAEKQQYLLSDSNTLSVDWEPKVLNDESASWDRLEQLSWLQVDPAGARLEVQLLLKGLRSLPRVLELDISPQLKLALLSENSYVQEVIPPTLQHPTRLRLRLQEGLSDDLIIPLRFDLQRATTVGQIYFPRVRLVNHTPDQSLFGVTVSAGLSYDENIRGFLRRIEPTEFSSLWNNASDDPLYAYALGQEDPDWSLRVWPDPQSIAAQQTLRVYCSQSQVDVEFDATLDKLTGNWLLHRIRVPKSLVIEDITVEDQSHLGTIPVRWSRASETEVVVFMGQPVSEPHLLQLRGHLDVAADSEIEIPKVQLLENDRGEIHLDLYRTDDVRVVWEDPELSLEEVTRPQISQNLSEIHIGHLSWRATDTTPLAKLRIKKNEKSFDISSVTALSLSSDGWSVTVGAQVQIRKGIIQRLSIEAPQDFLGPYTLEPAQIGVLGEIVDTPIGKKLTVLLAKPVGEDEELQLRLSGSLEQAANQRLSFPAMRWQEATRQDHFVLLPSMVNEQPMEWLTNGLRRAKLPRKLQTYAKEYEYLRPYHVEQAEFQATERSFRGELRTAAIRSANVSGTLDRQGALAATAELILQPGRATSCVVQLPASATLTQLVVGDQPVRREMQTPGRWRIPLGPAFLPRRILIGYHQQHDLDDKRLLLEAPQVFIGDQALPTPQALWRIKPTADLQLGEALAGRKIGAAHFDNEDYSQKALTMNDAQAQVRELPTEEANAWLRMWENLIAQVESARSISVLSNSKETGSDSAESDIALRRAATLRNYPPTLPLHLSAMLEDPTRYYLSNANGKLILQAQSYSLQSLWRSFAAITLVCGTFAVVLKLRSKPKWYRTLAHWPHTLALGGGLCWWLMLKPSAAGLLVITLALLSLVTNWWRQPLLKPDTQLTTPVS